jgi:biopolymer transport protein ExbB/TolQ
MPIAAKLDEFGKPAWILLLILGFVWWLPLGLAIFAFMIGSGRMGSWNHKSRWQDGMSRWQDRTAPRSSGNRAFDEYRADTVRRLQEEQREFKEFLQRLRSAKDRAEFDQFMAARHGRPRDDAPQPHAQPSGLPLIAASSPAARH